MVSQLSSILSSSPGLKVIRPSLIYSDLVLDFCEVMNVVREKHAHVGS